MTRALMVVLAGQFLSTFADNAALFVAIALLKRAAAPAWHIPFLQEYFVAAFVVLAPFVGPLADAQSKRTVLLQGAVLRLGGAVAFALGASPFLAYALIGLGSAVSSPAKSGILSELCRPGALVRANSWLEASTVLALLAGAMGGAAFSDDHSGAAVFGLIAAYVVAGLVTLAVPRIAPLRPGPLALGRLFASFWPMVVDLLRWPKTRLSLAGTALFWGVAAVLRFLLLAWLPVALGYKSLAMVGYLTAATALGMAVGSVLAGHFVPIEKASRVVGTALLMGALVAALAYIHSTGLAVVAIVAIGMLGGFFLVPMNALLQEEGRHRVGGGGAIAVQNLVDNVGMLILVAAYQAAQRAGISPRPLALGVGAALFGCALLLTAGEWWMRRQSPAPLAARRI